MELKEDLKITGKLTIRKYKGGKLIHTQHETNKVVSSSGHGRNLLIRQLAGDITYGIEIDSGKIGTDATAPVDGNTDLGTVVLDGITVEKATFSNDTATWSFFIIDSALANGTYNEFGMFIGSQMFSRAIFSSPYSKSTGESTRVDYQIVLGFS